MVARSLIGNETLTALNLSYNHFGKDAAIFSIAKFITDSDVIQILNISYNSVKERGSICIADALKQSSSLKELFMDGNPVGPKGGRELLKMIANNGNMRMISLDHCNFEMPDDGPIPFDINEPNGFYKLDLSLPYDRMIAKSLQELAYTQGGECWRGEKLDGVFFDFPEDDPMAWDVPEEGILELAFVSNKPLENSEMNASQFEIIKRQITNKGSGHGDNQAQGLISQLSNTFAFNSSQVGEIIENFENSSSKVSVATRLFTQVIDTDNAEKLLSKLNQLERKQVEKKLGQFYYFNNRNPTGHYRLNLNLEFERLVATRIAECNKIERLSSRMEGKMDLTQKGNWENLRNETYNGEPFSYTTNFEIPDKGIFEFDYVSTVRPESEAVPMSDSEFDAFFKEYITLEHDIEIDEEELEEIFLQFDDDGGGTIDVEELGMIMRSLGQVMSDEEVAGMFNEMDDDGSGGIDFDEFLDLWEMILKRVKEQDRLITLRRQSANVFVSAKQIALMLKRFFKPLERVEIFVIFFCRLVDEENMHLALGELIEAEKEALMHRLGALNLFNPFKPDGRYTLDLAQHDTHLLATILIKLAIGESGNAIYNECYNGFPFSLPASWTKLLPRKGVYELSFLTPPPLSERKEIPPKPKPQPPPMSPPSTEERPRRSTKKDTKRERRSSAVLSPASISRDSRGVGKPALLKQGTMKGGIFLSSPGNKSSNAYPGNTKLRRTVAEKYLGWEFMEEDDENDLSSQHEALSRRRSSVQSKINTDDIRDTLIMKERERSRLGTGGWGDEEPSNSGFTPPMKSRGFRGSMTSRSSRRSMTGTSRSSRASRESIGRSRMGSKVRRSSGGKDKEEEGELNLDEIRESVFNEIAIKRKTKWDEINRKDSNLKQEMIESIGGEGGVGGGDGRGGG